MSQIPSPEQIYATLVAVATNTRLSNFSTGKQILLQAPCRKLTKASVASLTWIIYDIIAYFDQEVRDLNRN